GARGRRQRRVDERFAARRRPGGAAMNEDVMVVETAALEPHFRGRAFDVIRDDAPAIMALIASQHFFVPRAEAEVQPKWRQIIPYVVITHGDDVFTLRRLRKQTEARLHD